MIDDEFVGPEVPLEDEEIDLDVVKKIDEEEPESLDALEDDELEDDDEPFDDIVDH